MGHFIADNVRLPPDPRRVRLHCILYSGQVYVTPGRTFDGACATLGLSGAQKVAALDCGSVEVPLADGASALTVSSVNYRRDRYQ